MSVIELAPLRMSDGVAVARLAGDWEVARWTASIPHPYTPRDATDWISRLANSRTVTGRAIRHSDQLVGCITCDLSTGEIGFWIGRRFWARGFASAALSSFVKALVDYPSMPRLWSATLPENERSQAVLRSAGFEQSGTIVLPPRIRHQGSILTLFRLKSDAMQS